MSGGVRGISALTVNGHSSEVHACTPDEQREVLRITLEEVGDRLPIVAGIYADGSLEAARLARQAEADGAAALLVFPPQSMSMGGQSRPEMALAHFSTIAAATSLPLICFNYTLAGGAGSPHETLPRLAEAVPQIRAIKDWSGDPALHERNIRALQSLPRPVTVLTTHSAWLLSSLVLGCNGLLSGAGSVIAGLQVALYEAVRDNDLARARAINERIYPLAEAFYAPPFVDMHNRMKEALAILGRIPAAHVRPPLTPVSDDERHRIRLALRSAGLST
jgi:4-hydroxy-tetrahydrodipicolinate synthase